MEHCIHAIEAYPQPRSSTLRDRRARSDEQPFNALGSDDDRTGRVVPRALNAREAGIAQLCQVRFDAADEAVAVEEPTAGFEEIVDRAVARIELFRIPEIVQRDRRDREVKGAADLLRP